MLGRVLMIYVVPLPNTMENFKYAWRIIIKEIRTFPKVKLLFSTLFGVAVKLYIFNLRKME